MIFFFDDGIRNCATVTEKIFIQFLAKKWEWLDISGTILLYFLCLSITHSLALSLLLLTFFLSLFLSFSCSLILRAKHWDSKGREGKVLLILRLTSWARYHPLVWRLPYSISQWINGESVVCLVLRGWTLTLPESSGQRQKNISWWRDINLVSSCDSNAPIIHAVVVKLLLLPWLVEVDT